MAANLVLITGASSGIGEATARRFGATGAHVLLLARNAERLDDVAAAISKHGGTATAYNLDLADSGAIEEVAARIEREVGTPHILINNAGAGRWLPLIETTAKEALAMIEVPYLAAFNITRAFLPKMLARRSGTIACITSPASYVAWPNATAYTAARAALRGFTEALRADVKGSGLAVTLVVLGTVESPYWEHNPGSREHLPDVNPTLMPTLSTEEAAETIFAGIASGKQTVVKPAILRALFLLNAVAPRLVARELSRAAKQRS